MPPRPWHRVQPRRHVTLDPFAGRHCRSYLRALLMVTAVRFQNHSLRRIVESHGEVPEQASTNFHPAGKTDDIAEAKRPELNPVGLSLQDFEFFSEPVTAGQFLPFTGRGGKQF